jgi:hypothetical protein
MKKAWLLNAVLLVGVAALALFAHLKPSGDAPAAHSVSTLNAGGVGHIRIERSGGPPITLERKEGEWLITAPLSAPADPFLVERLLAILAARPAYRLAATGLARFDLDPPRTRLIIDGDTFGFGAVNTVMREQYVLTEGAVYAVELRYGAALPASPAQLIRKQLFGANEVPVRLELSGFTVAQSAGRWLVSPQSAEISQDDVGHWVDAWRHAAAARVELHDRIEAKAVDDVRVELRGGGKLVFSILQREPDLVIVRPDTKLQYHFFAETARRLLAPPGSTSSKHD